MNEPPSPPSTNLSLYLRSTFAEKNYWGGAIPLYLDTWLVSAKSWTQLCLELLFCLWYLDIFFRLATEKSSWSLAVCYAPHGPLFMFGDSSFNDVTSASTNMCNRNKASNTECAKSRCSYHSTNYDHMHFYNQAGAIRVLKGIQWNPENYNIVQKPIHSYECQFSLSRLRFCRCFGLISEPFHNLGFWDIEKS